MALRALDPYGVCPDMPEEIQQIGSAKNLAEFVVAARLYLPKITIEADRAKARDVVADLLGDANAKAAA